MAATKFNTLLAVTWVIDYVLFWSFMWVCHLTLADSLTAVGSAVSILALLFISNVRDEFWVRVGPSHIVAQVKKDQPVSVQDYVYMAQQLLLFVPLTMSTTAMGLFNFHDEGVGTLVRIFGEFYLMCLAKDNISMRFGHKWMHTSMSGWQHHKGHHFGGKNLRLVLAYHGQQWVDLLLETFSGPVLLFAFNYLVLGRFAVCHIGAWFMLVWADHNAHSCNPFSVAFFNPIADYVLLHTVAHHLHHSHPSTHMLFVPYEHAIPGSGNRAKDLEVYNATMNTRVDFRWFIDEDDTAPKTTTTKKSSKARA